MRRWVIGLVLALFVAGCGPDEPAADLTDFAATVRQSTVEASVARRAASRRSTEAPRPHCS